MAPFREVMGNDDNFLSFTTIYSGESQRGTLGQCWRLPIDFGGAALPPQRSLAVQRYLA